MANHMFDTQSQTTTGVKAANSLTKFPEFGATASVGVAGGTPTLTVSLRGWNNNAFKEILATFTLPVSSGTKTGDLFDSAVIAAQWENWDWSITAIGAGATATLTLSGSGI